MSFLCINNRDNKNNFVINNNIKKEYRNSEIIRPTSSSILECIATRSNRVLVADSKVFLKVTVSTGNLKSFKPCESVRLGLF